jgi:hypothetical protein
MLSAENKPLRRRLANTGLFTPSYAQTLDRPQPDRRVAAYAWRAAYVLDTNGWPDAEARITEPVRWLLRSKACPVTVRPAACLAKSVARF